MKCLECGHDGVVQSQTYYEAGMVARILNMSAANVRHLVRTGRLHYTALAQRTEGQFVYLFSDDDVINYQWQKERLRRMRRHTWGLGKWGQEPKQLELLD